MLNIVLVLLAGILFTMAAIVCICKESDLLQAFCLAVTSEAAVYTILAVVLLKLNRFSVNRCLIVTAGLAFVLFVIVLIKNKFRKPSWSLELKGQIIPILLCMIFFVAGISVVKDGFFGIDDLMGVNQAKTVNMISKLDINPLEAEYLNILSEEDRALVTEKTADIAECYEQYNPVIVASLALGGSLFGYQHMAYGLAMTLALLVYLLWFAGHYVMQRRGVADRGQALIVPLVVSVLLIAAGIVFYQNRETVLTWKSLDDIEDIISEYDAVVLDETVQKDLYIPIASHTRAKVYPMLNSLRETGDKVAKTGESFYYITSEPVANETFDEMDLNYKLVYQDSILVTPAGMETLDETKQIYIYRKLDFYQAHGDYNYADTSETVYLIALMLAGVIACMMIVSIVFTRVDSALNLLFSAAAYLLLYAPVSLVLMMFAHYSITYAAGLTSILLVVGAGIAYRFGKAPHFSYNWHRSLFLLIACVVLIVCGMIFVQKDFYGIKSVTGQNQLRAMEYIYNTHVYEPETAGLSIMPAYMALVGQLFGITQMMMVYPVFWCIAVIMVYIICERVMHAIGLRNKALHFVTLNGVLAVISAVAVTTLIQPVSSSEPVAEWKDIISYTDAIHRDDAVAIQWRLYERYKYPIQIMTGVSTCISTQDYDDALKKLDNNGNQTYYLTKEERDNKKDRIQVVSNREGKYMYRTYGYLSKYRIFSANDMIVQGFYPSELSGMAWNKDQVVYFQCEVPYTEYNTMRLYLGDSVNMGAININEIELEFRENWNYIARRKIDRDNNGLYVDFPVNWKYLIDGQNVFYIRSEVMWSPMIYGVEDTRIFGFPFHYIQFINTDEDLYDKEESQEETESIEDGSEPSDTETDTEEMAP